MKKEVAIFLVIFVAASIYSYYPIVSAHSLRPGTFYLMWSPAFAGIVTALIVRRNLKGFGWLPPQPIWFLFGYEIPIVYALMAYVVVWATGIGGFPNPDFIKSVQHDFPQTPPSQILSVTAYLFDLMVIGFIPHMLKPLGEEIGWRGFLVPTLAKKFSYTKVSLIVGIIWGIWHYPAILWTNYNIGTPGWFAIPCFTITVIAGSFITTWLRLRSGSFWPCVVWHNSHNAIIQAFFTPITVNREYTLFFIDEFGCALLITICAVAYMCWKDQQRFESDSVFQANMIAP
jgi:membrane protease YdiL (CAAX protease family)